MLKAIVEVPMPKGTVVVVDIPGPVTTIFVLSVGGSGVYGGIINARLV